jgi:DUF4097 and DUF4098 domain-containing protein YvlB
MRQFLVTVAILAMSIPAMARTRNVSISVDNDQGVTSCDDLRVRFDSGSGFRSVENVPVGNVRSLKVTAAHNGGIYVTGGRGYSVTACKAAEVESTLSQLATSVSGTEVTANGPDNDNWVVYFLVTVPRDGKADFEARNGPISLRDVAATITARAENGPISAKSSSGTLDLETHNGPISLAGGDGNVKLNAQNGPISVSLEDSMWNGSLDARTQNGPLTVKIPRNFRSGTLIESDGHGPVSCRGDVCKEAHRSWDDDSDRPRRIEFGNGATVVHMSTVNGPLSLKESE